MNAEEKQHFSRVLTRFLEERCVMGARYSSADKHLFAHFRRFWMQAPESFDHPALLGQFRVELRERGFCPTPGGKWPHWFGLALREQNQPPDQGQEDTEGLPFPR